MGNDLVPMTEIKGVPVRAVRAQISAIQSLMKSIMKENEHYGVIPGTTKKSLFKAGAEKIGLLFRLAPAYQVKEIWDRDHLTVLVSCVLQNINTGQVWGEGVGMCSTKEAKYRYRDGEGELTDKPVPKTYWESRNPELLGGKEFKAVKSDGRWMIARKGAKVEHDNPADYYNTVVKIGKKRAHVDAIITATAASDIFTQDIQDPEVDKEE